MDCIVHEVTKRQTRLSDFHFQATWCSLFTFQAATILLKVTCPTLCNPMDYTVHGILQPEYWSGQPFPSSGYLPNPGMEPRSPALQVYSLPAEPQECPRILEWVAYPFSRGSSLPRNRTGVSCIAGGFFTYWTIRESLFQDRSFGALWFIEQFDFTWLNWIQ